MYYTLYIIYDKIKKIYYISLLSMIYDIIYYITKYTLYIIYYILYVINYLLYII